VLPVRIGTCGWSYDAWRGGFYPAGTQPRDYLTYYAQRYSVVEVDSTFYRTPTLKMIREWQEKTPDHFGFSLKVPRVVTHDKVMRDCVEELEGFIAAVRLLKTKLLCCLLQFGYFNRSAFASLNQFLDRLDPFLAAWPKDVPVAVEVRNKAWMTPALGDCLREHGAVWVLPDQAWMPSPLSVVQRLDAVTGSFAYVRLLGDRAEVDERTEKLDRIVVDRSAQVRADAEAVYLLSRKVPAFVFVNNHFAGFAPQTVQQLRDELEEH
jgi:uncharacterized protein YecE (DUF72 family)